MRRLNIFTNSRLSQVFFQFIADIIAIWIGFAAQLYIRFFSGAITVITSPTIVDYILGSILMTIFWFIIFAFFGMYKNWLIRSPFSEFFAIFKSVFFGCIIIIILVFDNSATSFRALFIPYFCINIVSFTFFRYSFRKVQVLLRRKKIINISVIIVGDLKHSLEFYEKTQQQTNWGIRVIGFILFDDAKTNNNDMILGDISNLNEIIKQYVPEEIIISVGTPDSKILFQIETMCAENNIRVLIEPNLYDHFTGRTRTQNIYGIPLIEVSSQIMKPFHKLIKRIFDIVFSVLVIIIGMPIWLLVALVIKLESKGKVLYSQPRVGLHNNIFTIYKFRSMAQTLTKEQNWTKVGDPRVTRFGKFIRKTHLDEVPQFYNVLIGDMSVVGPRPEQPKFVDEFSQQLKYYNRRHIVRPGITGWWQIKYKSHILNLEEIKNRTKDDFYYIENLSLQLDFEILVRTVWCVISGHGQA